MNQHGASGARRGGCRAVGRPTRAGWIFWGVVLAPGVDGYRSSLSSGSFESAHDLGDGRIWGGTSMRGRALQVFKYLLLRIRTLSYTVLHQPLIETDDVKWRLAGQSATTVLNCAAQADIVRAFALCRVVR